MKALASSIASDNKIKLIRSKQSVYRYLVKKPVKLILFKLINVLTGPIYPQQNKGKSGNRSKDHLEFIIHPGTLKDKGFIW
jgi:hypothetical protein